MMQRLVSAFVLSRIDYCNSVFAGLPDTTLSPFWWASNASVRLVAGICPCDPIMVAMWELHWLRLPIGFHIKYKLCLLMHAAVNSFCSDYISISTDSFCSERFLPGIHLQGSYPGFGPSGLRRIVVFYIRRIWCSASRMNLEKTVYLHCLDRLLTLTNSNAPLRLIFPVLPTTFNCIFVFTC